MGRPFPVRPLSWLRFGIRSSTGALRVIILRKYEALPFLFQAFGILFSSEVSQHSGWRRGVPLWAPTAVALRGKGLDVHHGPTMGRDCMTKFSC